MAKTKKPAARRPAKTAKRAKRAAANAPAPTAPIGVTPYLALSDAAGAIEWYKKALGAKELTRQLTPDGKIMHGDLKIAGSRVMLSDIFPGSDVTDATRSGTPVTLSIYHKDVQKLWQKAVGNGAKVTMPLAKQFWGDWYGKLLDPYGHSWAFGYKAKMTAAEKQQLQEAAMKQFGAGAPPS